MGWETVVGLEIHVQLDTRSKLFCGDRVTFGAAPNTHVCPVCLGLPGALPVPNERAVELAVRAALGLGCTVSERSVFARKNYFYPDLPKGYQITQFHRPLARGGALAVPQSDDEAPDPGPDDVVRIRRIHLEEDAGKSLHDRLPGRTAIDLNRAGVPLIEIVTEPDLRAPGQARAFLAELKRVLEYLEVSDCDMETGSLRVDANISLRRAGADGLGTKTEIKNMNSFANVERALHAEVARQRSLLEAGRDVVHETLLWDDGRNEVRPMRSKEESHDYRYFPEPDLPPLVVDAGRIREIQASLPELPGARRRRLITEYGLPPYDAGVLTADRDIADYFEAVSAHVSDAKAASNWIMTEVLGWLNRTGSRLAELSVPPEELAALIGLVADGTLSSSAARTVFARMTETGRSAARIVDEEGLAQVSDADQLEAWVEEVLAAHPEEAERYRQGEEKLLSYFMGQIMKKSRGKADPRRATQILRQRLS